MSPLSAYFLVLQTMCCKQLHCFIGNLSLSLLTCILCVQYICSGTLTRLISSVKNTSTSFESNSWIGVIVKMCVMQMDELYDLLMPHCGLYAAFLMPNMMKVGKLQNASIKPLTPQVNHYRQIWRCREFPTKRGRSFELSRWIRYALSAPS